MKIRFTRSYYGIDMLGQTGIEKLKHIEQVARTCYKSEDKITDDSYIKMVRGLVKRDHTAMLEFADIHVKFTASRAFSHELVRHRIASFAQESQRYVGYGDVIHFIIPSWHTGYKGEEINGVETSIESIVDNISCWKTEAERIWGLSCVKSAEAYSKLLKAGWSNEQARDVLPNAAKTEINIKTNLRSWMNIDKLRNHATASPQMRELMDPLFRDFRSMIPIVFE